MAFPVLAVVHLAFVGGIVLPAAANDIFESPAALEPAGKLDKILFAKLATMKIKPVLCSDSVFVRRVYLDSGRKVSRMP